MAGAIEVLEILLHGVAIGALAATAMLLCGRGPSWAVRISGVFLCVAVIGYVVGSSPLIGDAVGPLQPVFRLLSFGGVGALWAFVLALFEDRKPSLALFAPFAGLNLYGLVVTLAPVSVQPNLWIGHDLLEVGVAGHALFVIWRSWRSDLVEARRRLRGLFLAGVAVFAVTLSAFEIGDSFGLGAAWYPLTAAAALAILCLAGTVVLFQVRPVLFEAAAVAGQDIKATGANAADRAEMARVNASMDQGEAWRREGLTIVVLAQELRMPEHRLRRLINDHLGHRNFAAFVNMHRIEAAKRLLSDPAEARRTISSIAYDIGFGSLGPFNRAFKEATGVAPSEWRKDALETGSPNLKNPR